MNTDNQLLAESNELPDIGEYDGLSVVDIAHAIINWPDGSEDQARAIAALRARAPGIGHNRPPLSEALGEELAPHRARADQLLAVASQAIIVDEVSAQKTTDLVRQMSEFERDLDELRKRRVAPYVAAQRLINDEFNGVIQRVRLAREGEDRRGGLRRMLTEYAAKREAEAEAARQAALEEQRRREHEAEEARRRAEEAAAHGRNSTAAEIQAAEAQEEAERAARRAAAIRPEPIRANLGVVTRAREIRVNVISLRKALGAILKLPGGENAALQFAMTFLGKYLRGLGVEMVQRGVEIAGVEVTVEKGAARVRQ